MPKKAKPEPVAMSRLIRSFQAGRFKVTISQDWPGDNFGDSAPALIECEPTPDGPVTDDEMAEFFRGRADVQREFEALAAARGFLVNVIETGTGPEVKVATTQ